MIDSHLSEDQLLALAEGRADGGLADQQHVARCLSCQEALSAYRFVSEGFSSPEIWSLGDTDAASAMESGFASVLAFRRRIDHEDADARPMIERLWTLPTAGWASEFASVLPTAGLVRALESAAAEARDRDPSRALAFATFACAMAHALTIEEYPKGVVATLRGLAFKEKANALRYLGQFNDALDALNSAESVFQTTIAGAFDLACVDLIRATIHTAQGKRTEARALASRAAEVFEEFGDVDRLAKTRFVEVVVLLAEDRVLDAKALLLDLLHEHESAFDLETRARIVNNLAECCSRLREFDDASMYYLQAMALFGELGLATEVARVSWGLGFLLLQSWKLPAAIDRLRLATRDLEALGMTSEAAVATLDLVSALLEQGEASEVAALCRTLPASFRAKGMSAEAERAAQFLAQAEVRGALSRAHVTQVRAFLERLPEDPTLRFSPSPLAS